MAKADEIKLADASGDSRWSLEGTSSPAREEPAMAYESAVGGVVPFGGCCGSPDTWEWDGSARVQRTPTKSPPTRNPLVGLGRRATQRAFELRIREPRPPRETAPRLRSWRSTTQFPPCAPERSPYCSSADLLSISLGATVDDLVSQMPLAPELASWTGAPTVLTGPGTQLVLSKLHP